MTLAINNLLTSSICMYNRLFTQQNEIMKRNPSSEQPAVSAVNQKFPKVGYQYFESEKAKFQISSTFHHI